MAESARRSPSTELILELPAYASVKVTVTTPSVQVARGGSALLPCSFRTTAALNRLNIIWTVSPLVEPQYPLQIISYEQGQIVGSLSDYLGRVGFAFHPTKDASIFINQTRSSDTGTYQCTVINPPDGATPNIGVIGLTVLVPPSSPECSSEGYGQEGGSIRLHCSVREGIPTPRFKWEKIPPDTQALVIKQEGDHHASVTLHNLSAGTSGLYRCTVTNQLGSRSCAVALNVQIAMLGTLGIIVGVTITLFMGLVLLALFALVLCLHHQSRGKDQEADEMCNNNRVDVFSTARPQTQPQCHDKALCNRVTKPLWTLDSQSRDPSSDVLYNVHRSQLSLTVQDTSNYRSTTPSSREDESPSESSGEDHWVQHPTTVLRTSLYPANSGFLV
ncbi:immunoglobulin superfamily member 11-like [Bombina bombina]|uniref:immunoglobulin superfamily member 11-like n=1 Tax=Bombina bombina TaxID=8345 RepID=UPI00235B0547|nr:immunoglobulin superfamily member 11-like [Bombina bombina]